MKQNYTHIYIEIQLPIPTEQLYTRHLYTCAPVHLTPVNLYTCTPDTCTPDTLHLTAMRAPIACSLGCLKAYYNVDNLCYDDVIM